MDKKTITVVGTYIDLGKIRLASGKILAWDDLDPPHGPPEIPYGAKAELTIVLDAPDYLHGVEGAIWATYDRYQAEIVQGALQSQKIACELRESYLNGFRLYVLRVRDPTKSDAAIDFVWRDPGGLGLQPDWRYPAGAVNESFLRWTKG